MSLMGVGGLVAFAVIALVLCYRYWRKEVRR